MPPGPKMTRVAADVGGWGLPTAPPETWTLGLDCAFAWMADTGGQCHRTS
ncbi:MAG: hypothetical protein JWL71_1852 [Acidobacteria bacterium]|nr:hypothetical protein [Acidobacteriota bacterium]